MDKWIVYFLPLDINARHGHGPLSSIQPLDTSIAHVLHWIGWKSPPDNMYLQMYPPDTSKMTPGQYVITTVPPERCVLATVPSRQCQNHPRRVCANNCTIRITSRYLTTALPHYLTTPLVGHYLTT